MNHDGSQFSLYHGTNANLKPGDVINPQQYSKAFATSSLDEAKNYAKTSRISNKGNTEPSLFGAVYKVAPLDHEEMTKETTSYNLPNTNRGVDSNYFVSRKGFKVLGLEGLE